MCACLGLDADRRALDCFIKRFNPILGCFTIVGLGDTVKLTFGNSLFFKLSAVSNPQGLNEYTSIPRASHACLHLHNNLPFERATVHRHLHELSLHSLGLSASVSDGHEDEGIISFSQAPMMPHKQKHTNIDEGHSSLCSPAPSGTSSPSLQANTPSQNDLAANMLGGSILVDKAKSWPADFHAIDIVECFDHVKAAKAS
jgi:hypothetical protein